MVKFMVLGMLALVFENYLDLEPISRIKKLYLHQRWTRQILVRNLIKLFVLVVIRHKTLKEIIRLDLLHLISQYVEYRHPPKVYRNKSYQIQCRYYTCNKFGHISSVFKKRLNRNARTFVNWESPLIKMRIDGIWCVYNVTTWTYGNQL